jgi:PHD/YefM family antitoxin component YafN of YafNO toxin-antitoxin module
MFSLHAMVFKTLSEEEYGHLSLEQRLEYLQRLMEDIRRKVAESRQQLEQAKKVSEVPPAK